MIAWKVQNPYAELYKRRLVKIGVDDLVNEFQYELEDSAPNDPVTVNFSDRQLQPPLLLEFIKRLEKRPKELFNGKGTITFDLYDNRLALLSKENFEAIFTVVKEIPNMTSLWL